MTGTELRVAGLTHRHRGAAIATLADVSFVVPAGAIAAIVGESGAGKTTLLRCLAGLERAERGTIRVGTHVVEAGRASGAVLRGHVGLVFQSFELFPHLTVLENCILAPMRVRRVARAAAETTAQALLAQLGLADKATEHPSRLSGGQCQRVAIARALAMAPRLVLADEPTGNLDTHTADEVFALLREFNRKAGVTFLVVTHDPRLADRCDRIIELVDGRVVRDRA